MSQRKPIDLFGLLVIALGTACGVHAGVFLDVTALNFGYGVILLVTFTCSSYLIVKIPGTKGEITVSDSLIFLTLLLYGGEAAILLAVADGLSASIRRRLILHRLGNCIFQRRHGVALDVDTATWTGKLKLPPR